MGFSGSSATIGPSRSASACHVRVHVRLWACLWAGGREQACMRASMRACGPPCARRVCARARVCAIGPATRSVSPCANLPRVLTVLGRVLGWYPGHNGPNGRRLPWAHNGRRLPRAHNGPQWTTAALGAQWSNGRRLPWAHNGPQWTMVALGVPWAPKDDGCTACNAPGDAPHRTVGSRLGSLTGVRSRLLNGASCTLRVCALHRTPCTLQAMRALHRWVPAAVEAMTTGRLSDAHRRLVARSLHRAAHGM
jgi:hypothetical protein